MVTHTGVFDENSETFHYNNGDYYCEDFKIEDYYASSGETIEIELSSDDFDPELSLRRYSEDDISLEDTGKRSVLPARITFEVADNCEASDYVIGVTSTTPEEVGDYELTYRKV